MDWFSQAGINPAVIKPVRSWTDFFQTASFRLPSNGDEAYQRLTQNLKYYQSNYFVVFALLLLYCLYKDVYIFYLYRCLVLRIFYSCWDSLPR